MRLLAVIALLFLALPVMAQEATETPEPEVTATPDGTAGLSPLLDYAWCGYLLLEGIVVDEDALAMLAALFPAADTDTPAQAMMQWRARPDGAAGILEGCHLLPVERWRIVSLLQQGTGMEYAQMDESLVLTEFATVDEVLAYLETHAAEWEEADEPEAEATPDL